MKRKMCQGNIKRTPDEHLSETEMWSFLASAIDKKRAAKRRRPDMYREALLQRTVQRLNDEITERSMKRTKKRKSEEKYEWQDGPNGWCMTDGMNEDDDDLLGINSFLSELSSTKPNKRKREEILGNNNLKSAVLPSFSETFGENRTKNLSSKSVDEQRIPSSGSNMARCRAGLFQPQISLVEKFDSLCC
jgi:hypothetical protein